MHTHFSDTQLADPALADAARVIRSCVRHGFCPQTCPTYVLSGDENDSPRGRIDLARAMLERGGAPDAATVAHLDGCLGCLACESVCAARVDYRHLIDRARAHVERHFRRPWRERLWRALVAAVLSRPARLGVAVRVGHLARAGQRVLPRALRELLRLLPAKDAAGAPRAVPPPATHAGPPRRVALVAGCVQQVLGARINAAILRLLARCGCEVVLIDGDACCGALDQHMGREAEARARAGRLVTRLANEMAGAGLDAIVIGISGCGTTLKDYGHLFAHDATLAATARAVAARVRDISEYLDACGFAVATPAPALPLAYHDACSLRHGQRVTAAPRRLLRAAGFDLREVPEGHFCCGSAGTYNLLQPTLAAELGRRKARAIAASGAVAVAAGNLGCMVQLTRHGDRPLLHTAELLDWAAGGPLPAALAGIDLSAYPARTAVPVTAIAASAEEEINFWVYEAGT